MKPRKILGLKLPDLDWRYLRTIILPYAAAVVA
jgi:hypothetical protein